jgi:hypothetical protein
MPARGFFYGSFSGLIPFMLMGLWLNHSLPVLADFEYNPHRMKIYSQRPGRIATESE